MGQGKRKGGRNAVCAAESAALPPSPEPQEFRHRPCRKHQGASGRAARHMHAGEAEKEVRNRLASWN